MIWFLSGLALLLLSWLGLHWLGNTGRKAAKKAFILAGLVVLTLVIVGLFFVGRLPSHLAGLGVVAIWLPKLWTYFNRARMAWRFGKYFHERYKDRQDPTNATMGRQEAFAELGLQEGASKDDILQAYQKLMKEAHPDRGGDNRRAARLNIARDILLE
ncbi:MAG: DnaJ domain-containing protein [Pseudomonadota bacterium]